MEAYNDNLDNDLYEFKIDPIPFQTIPVAKFASLVESEWIIKNYLPKAELAVFYGEPGCGKTFMALAMSMAVARGIDWEHERTTQGRVVYICAEGVNGFRKRTLAYLLHHSLIGQDISLDVITDSPNFLDEIDSKKVSESILKNGKASIIVVDTFSRVMPGGNENSGEDMGRAIQQCKVLHSLTDAIIILIHHSGKDTARGARGWSGLLGACDTEIEVKKIGKSHRAKITKQKDGEMGHEWGFDLKIVELGTSETTGDIITSCVYQSSNCVPIEDIKNKPLGKNDQIVYDAFRLLNIFSVDIEDLIEICEKSMIYDPKRGDRRRDMILRSVKSLKSKNLVDFIDNHVCKM